MHGQSMRHPLQAIDLLKHAHRNHWATEIVSRRVEGDVHRYTYADAYRRVCRLFRAFTRLGVVQGDRVATLAWNTYRHLEIYYAAAGVRAVCHTLNPRLTADQIAWICNHAGDSVLCFDATFEPLVQQILPKLKTVKHVILLSGSPTVMHGCTVYDDLLEAESDNDVDWPEIDENEPCGLCYTSGTTGDPKGVSYSHRSTVLHAYASALPDSLALSATDAVMPVVPMFHVNAWGLPYSLPMVGAKMVLPGPALDGKSLYELCEAEGVTMAAGVPTIWQGLLEHVRSIRGTFSSMERTVIGGAAASESMIRAFELEHDVRVLHGWGMTETSPAATVNQFKRSHRALPPDAKVKLQTRQGREIFGAELRLESPEGEVLPRDGKSHGHLLVRGHWVVHTYEGGVPAARADGWFDTGDIANIDPDGYMQVVDRSKDVIKSGGEWISSIELENAAMSHPAVLEAAVIALPHPKWGERPLLLCVLRPAMKVSAAELRHHLSGRVARWWLPEAIEFIEAIPHGATGKVLKTKLREQFSDYPITQEASATAAA